MFFYCLCLRQAERYREALADLRYMLRLEPPPAKGVPVSKDILDVQKMAKDCEQKVHRLHTKGTYIQEVSWYAVLGYVVGVHFVHA